MIATKDIWMALTSEEKLNKIQDALNQLDLIGTGRHQLSNKYEQGRLAAVKKDLEKFIINALSWESDRQTSRH